MTEQDFLPGPAERRQMLESTLQNLKCQGYSMFIEIQAIEAQYPNAKPSERIKVTMQDGRVLHATLGEYVGEQRAEMKRAQAAAKRMQELIDEFPKGGVSDAPACVDGDTDTEGAE